VKTPTFRRIVRDVMLLLGVAFILLLSFPQLLFAHETSFKQFHVYSRRSLDQHVNAVLDTVEARLATSPIHDDSVAPKVFLTDSYRLYRSLSLNLGWNSFGKGYPVTYLLEQKKLSVDDLFDREFDVAALEEKALATP